MASPYQPSSEDIIWKKGLLRLSKKDLNERLCDAVHDESIWRVREALATGADVHACGEQPIRKAAVSGLYQIARVLIEAGADVHINDEEPLCWAARAGNAALVEFFLSRGADEKSWGGRRAREWALDYDRQSSLFLLDHAAEIRTNKAVTGLGMAERISEALDSEGALPLAEIKKGDVKSDVYLYILGDAKKLELLFEPKFWVGDVQEMIKLWDRIPVKYKSQVDLPAKVTGVGLYTVHSFKPPKFKLK